MHDRLDAMRSSAGVTRAQFEDEERACGIAFNADGVLGDAELRGVFPPSKYARDPMHTMLAGGVVSVE
eukprot:7059333-Alexandrium_andersonii.AAC.1